MQYSRLLQVSLLLPVCFPLLLLLLQQRGDFVCGTTAAGLRTVSPVGFHRTLRTSLLLDRKQCGCMLEVRETLPGDVFVDPFELAELSRLVAGASFTILPSEHLSLEAPAGEIGAPPLTIVAIIPPPTERLVELSLPFHTRYLPPLPHSSSSKDSAFREISIPPPSLTLHCNSSSFQQPGASTSLCLITPPSEAAILEHSSQKKIGGIWPFSTYSVAHGMSPVLIRHPVIHASLTPAVALASYGVPVLASVYLIRLIYSYSR